MESEKKKIGKCLRGNALGFLSRIIFILFDFLYFLLKNIFGYDSGFSES